MFYQFHRRKSYRLTGILTPFLNVEGIEDIFTLPSLFLNVEGVEDINAFGSSYLNVDGVEDGSNSIFFLNSDGVIDLLTLTYVDNENSLGNYSLLNDLNAVTLGYVYNSTYINDLNQVTLEYVTHNISSYFDVNQITLGYVDTNIEAISDYPPVTLSVSPSSVAENSGTNIVYTFTRASDPGLPITINYLVGGTANSSDYTGTSPGLNTITLSSGTSTTLTITPSPDLVNEPNDTIEITLQSGLGYSIGTTTAVIATINNDD